MIVAMLIWALSFASLSIAIKMQNYLTRCKNRASEMSAFVEMWKIVYCIESYCSIEISNKSRSISHSCAMNMSYEHIRQHWLLSLCMDKYWSVRYNIAHHMQISCVHFGENSAHKQKKTTTKNEIHTLLLLIQAVAMLWFSHSLAAIKNLVSKHDVRLVSLLVGIFVVRFGCDPLYANLWNKCISISLIEQKLKKQLNSKSTYSRTLACIKRIFHFLLSSIFCSVTLCTCAKTKFSAYWENKSGLPWKYIRYVVNEAM